MSVRVLMYNTAGCPYCRRAEALLRQRGVGQIKMIHVDREPGRRQEMIERTGRRTVPQIYIGERHIGGCDDLQALDRAGGLEMLLRGTPDTPAASGTPDAPDTPDRSMPDPVF